MPDAAAAGAGVAGAFEPAGAPPGWPGCGNVRGVVAPCPPTLVADDPALTGLPGLAALVAGLVADEQAEFLEKG